MEERKRETSEYDCGELRKISKKYDAVNISSGEPTMSPLLPKYAAVAKAAGFKSVEITTNGRMLSIPGYAEKLASAGIDRFMLSIHGSCPRVHDALTRTPGSFEQSIRGLENVSNMREKYGLKKGMQVQVVDYDNVLALMPLPADPVEALHGMLEGDPSLTEELLAERARERAREEDHGG